mmetsp:Transcript_1071/g.4267  ORF Transcript_1071/g.4267 Transcript_1071/m.4267 type:complete len:269 (+) Transcript_1071:31-837(+)
MSYQRHSTGADSTENMPPVNIEVSGSGIVLKETKKGALLDFSDPAPAAAAGPAAATAAAGAADLQAAFRDFQLKRRAEHKRTAELARLKRAEQKSSEAKAILRAKFLAAVREYLGVPYAVRFHSKPGEGPCECEGCTEAGEQLAERPLFLDCCALVRRAVSDLQEDFGFRLGPGNQAYQFDTLPVRVGTVEELEPGDLVFYEGVFFIEGKKAQPHDMLHVEVFVGGESGEAVIGSRERHKWVKEYDSYKFQSKSWTLKKHCAPQTLNP